MEQKILTFPHQKSKKMICFYFSFIFNLIVSKKIKGASMKLFIIICLFFSNIGFSQKLDLSKFENINIRNVGPAGMSGRITSIDVVNHSPNIIYVGSASGGVWKSINGGINWKPIFNDQTTASIGAIVIQQDNPSVVWVGTGEGNPRNSLNGGDGIYKTLDGGKTWNHMGLKKTRHIHRVIIHPQNPNIVYVGVIGSPWGEYQERGVYKTMDGGKNWKRILFTNPKSGVADMIMDPTNPNKLMVAMWEHKRDPWFFESGGKGSGIHITHDAGETWEQRTSKDGLPEGELGRIGIAIAPSMPNIVYALIESKKNSLYKSVDGGNKWKKINDKKDIGNRPFYYSEIYVDPINENRIYSIFTYVNVSEDGGKTFTRLMPAYGVNNGVHPDHHAWWIHPKDPNFIIDGNDGGLNITKDRGKTWRFIENIPVGQFYHIAVDNEFPYNIYGGMQDNGSWAGPAYVWKVQGIRNHYWQELSFGDGFDVLPDPTNSRYGISTSQQGFAVIYDRVSGYQELIRPTYPEGDVKLRFNWNVGMARDPFNPSTIYFGSQFVHKSLDGGQSWDITSPDLTTNDPDKQKQDDSGGLTIDATGAENHCTILVIEPSSIEKGVMWVGTDDGNVQITKNGGLNWNNVTQNIPYLPAGSWISQIKASKRNPGEALMVANDYRRFNYLPYAYRTKDYGQTWTRIVDEKDVYSYVLSIVEDPEEPRLLFLGTDDGLYVSIDAGNIWTKWTTKVFPTTNVYDLIIHPREHDLIIGTFGRSIWVLDDIRPLRALARKGINELNKTINVYEPPIAYVVAIQQATGTRFGGDALFNGENRKNGAMISYSINKPAKNTEKDEKPKTNNKRKSKKEPEEDQPSANAQSMYDSVTFEVLKNNEIIQESKWVTPKDNGIYRYHWNLREKGAKPLSRTESTTSNTTRGTTVLPGKYKLRFAFGDQKDSTQIEIKYDTRLNFSQVDIQKGYETLKLLEEKHDLLYQSVERIKEAINISKNIKKNFENKNKKIFEEQIKFSQSTIDTLNIMLDVIFGKKDERQGITRSTRGTASIQPTIISLHRNARRYVENAIHAPGKTELALIRVFENEMSEFLDMVNEYFQTEWMEYRKRIENSDISPFKDYQTIKY